MAIIAVIAAFPRFIAPDIVPFGYDEALEALRARAIALGARPVANEVTSWLLPDPALMLYVYALVEAAADPPIARTWLLGGLNTLSVVLAYFWGRSAGGPALGFGTAALYACNAWAIYFGRQPWVNIQPLLTSIMLLSATRVVQHRERAWSAPFFLALGLQTQTHLLGALLALPAALSILLFPRAWSWTILPGAIVVALINAPFAVHVWQQRDALEATLGGAASATAAAAATAEVGRNALLDAPRLLAWFVGGLEVSAKLAEGAEALRPLAQPQLVTGWVTVAALLLGVILALLVCARRASGWKGYALALIWIVAPQVAAMAQSRPVYIHYMTALAPACFLLAALPFSTLFSLHRLAGIIGMAVILLVGVVQQMVFSGLLQGVRIEASLPPDSISASERQARLNDLQRRTRAMGIGDLFGTPLSYWHDLSAGVRSIAAQRQTDMITVYTGLSDPYELYVDRRRMALDYLLGNGMVARFPFEGTVILPLEQPGLVLQLPGIDLPRAIRNPERLFQVPTPGSRDETSLLAVPARPLREQSLGRRSIQARFEPGLQLVSYDSPQRLEPGETLALTTYWTFSGLSDTVREHGLSVFFHLLDQDGAIRAQSDGLGLPSSLWRSGDLVVRRVTLTIPSDRAGARFSPVLGVYDPVTLQRVQVTLADNRQDDRVVLEPISVR